MARPDTSRDIKKPGPDRFLKQTVDHSEWCWPRLSAASTNRISTVAAFRDHVDKVAETSGTATQTRYEFVQVSTLIAMAEAGLGVALLPRIAIPASTRLSSMLIKPRLKRVIAVASIKGARPSPTVNYFIGMYGELMAPS
ncbi:LysR substrate-binding domain-containing protein [Paraburkholderia lycopersici]|nr:LysR substrate-binding domain-containing protein [Paraburkholderia lycopersici]